MGCWMRAIGLLLLAGIAMACGSPSDKSAQNTAKNGVVAVEPVAIAPRFQLLGQDLATTGTILRLRWPHEVAPPEDPPVLAFCLPAGRQIKACWLEARLGGEAITIELDRPIPATKAKPKRKALIHENAGSVEFEGYLRHWPVYRLQLGREVMDLVKKGPGGQQTSKNLELTLKLDWREPVAIAPAPKPAQESLAQQSWRRVAEKLVLNPGALDVFYSATMPEPANQTGKVTDPRLLAPGKRFWARLQGAQDGLIRLDPDELIKVGFPAAQVRPEAIRIFSHGKPVPLLLAPGPQAPPELKPGVYFWAQGGKGDLHNTSDLLGDAGRGSPRLQD